VILVEIDFSSKKAHSNQGENVNEKQQQDDVIANSC
jgi:hypothetical protein